MMGEEFIWLKRKKENYKERGWKASKQEE